MSTGTSESVSLRRTPCQKLNDCSQVLDRAFFLWNVPHARKAIAGGVGDSAAVRGKHNLLNVIPMPQRRANRLSVFDVPKAEVFFSNSMHVHGSGARGKPELANSDEGQSDMMNEKIAWQGTLLGIQPRIRRLGL